MTDHIKTETRGPVLIAAFNRPDKLNAITRDMALALKAAHESFAADTSLRVMLIRAEGRYFSAGADITGDLLPDPNQTSQTAFRAWYRASTSSLHPMFDAFEACEKPVVVAHQGPCLGGALEMSLSCDYRIASTAATYGLPEIDLGGLPGSGGMSRLTRLVGPAWARWLAVAGETVSAEQALTMGMVQAVHPPERFEAEVMAFCERLAAKPPEAVAAGKLAIEMIADLDRAQGRNVERLTVGSLVMGEEFGRIFSGIKAKMTGRS
ncbi:MAG: enoyl-CoA hydratase/isomerase family protein [Sagittula sp.]|uniref:enoyl-CoA hydratase/isomerase family protein n=1 Tax=Sagittula sp. TaxID=2038081 RepID=UPI004059D701